MSRRAFFYIRQTLHNLISILTASVAILAAAGWVESGHYLRSLAALIYFAIWVIAQLTPASDGKFHNTSFIS